MKFPDKFSEENLDYQMDFSLRLATGDTIATATATVVSGGVTADPAKVTIAGKVVTFWLAGGNPNQTAEVLIDIVTAGARTHTEPAFIRIVR